MSRPTLVRLLSADLARVAEQIPELWAIIEQSTWAEAAEHRWGCCGIMALRGVDNPAPSAVVLAAPSLHAPIPLVCACERSSNVAVQVASWALEDDVRTARAATSALAGALAQGRIMRLEALACAEGMAPTPVHPSALWLTSCGFHELEPGVFVLDVGATARTHARAAVQWLAGLRMSAPRPASEGSTGRVQRNG